MAPPAPASRSPSPPCGPWGLPGNVSASLALRLLLSLLLLSARPPCALSLSLPAALPAARGPAAPRSLGAAHRLRAGRPAALRRPLSVGPAGESGAESLGRRGAAGAHAWQPLRLAPRPPCLWCAGRADGTYADHRAQPAGSRSFSCRDQQLVAVAPCPRGAAFDERRGECRQSSSSSSRRDAAVEDGEGKRLLPTAASSGGASLRGEGAAARGRSATSRQLARQALAAPAGPSWAEVSALLDFKARHLDTAGVLDGWVLPREGNSTVAACRWQGVVCGGDGRVEELTVVASGLAVKFGSGIASIPPSFSSLDRLQILSIPCTGRLQGFAGLAGSLPSELGSLQRLSQLVLSDNQLEGPLPASLSALTALQQLDLQRNSFSSSFPDWVGPSWQALTSLNLAENFFFGSLPSSLGALPRLQYLNLLGNQLSGSIPSELSGLASLEYLSLGGNPLETPPPEWIGDLQNLTCVNLSHVTMRGPIPDAWSSVKAPIFQCANCSLSGPMPPAVFDGMCRNGLVTLDLSYNSLSGPLPFSVATCSKLEYLNLQHNQLSGGLSPLVHGLPTTALSAASLQYLILSSNRLGGSIPAELSALNLMQLSLDSNNLTGPLPDLHCINSLSILTLSANSLSGSLPASFGDGCTAVDQFDLSSNYFSGPLPAALLSTFHFATTINISFNHFSGPLPAPARYVQIFAADANDFSGPLPTTFSQCSSLAKLSLAANPGLVGEVPPHLLSGSTSLVALNLSRTGLGGPLPMFLTHMPYLMSLDLSHCQFSGPLFPQLAHFPWLQFLDVSHNRLTGPLPAGLDDLSSAVFLSFASNNLSGSIPPQLAPVLPNKHLSQLQLLDLSQNALSGAIPFQFSLSPANATLNFSFNNLSGPIPEGTSGVLSRQSASLFAGNPGLCGGPGYAACPGAGGLSAGAVAGICVGAAVGLLLLLLLLWRLMPRGDKWEGGTMLVFEKLSFKLTVQDVLRATNNFSEEHYLGKGGFGPVYRATLPDGSVVAVKRLAQGSQQGDREFQAEMRTLGSIRHRNLVTLVAAYSGRGAQPERLLLYRFLPGGSMDRLLAGEMEKDSPLLRWELRLRMALDTARGLKYLHHDCTPRLIHRDMKPANVLLDEHLTAYVADFGLAREIDATYTHVQTKACLGTLGYIAPEYVQLHRLSFKSDVFAFGVLLLQLVTGMQPLDARLGRGLRHWVASSPAAAVDPRMALRPEQELEVQAVMRLGLQCTSRVAADRPGMDKVLRFLENLSEQQQR